MDELISLSQLFHKKLFRIPIFQRGYAWGEEQLQDFWDDLDNLQDGRSHYTGMLSLKKINEKSYVNWKEEKWILLDKGYEAYYVIDGQQRLTTFIILVSSIIKFALSHDIKEINGDEINDVKSQYLVEYKKPERLFKAYKLDYEIRDFDESSSKYLRYYVFGEDKPGTILETFYTYNLEYACEFFEKKISDLFKKSNKLGIDRIFRKLVNNLKFIVYKIDDEFNINVAFETMNNRGKKLSNLELLKNRLVYLTTIYSDEQLSPDGKKSLIDKIDESWSEIYKELGRNKKKPLDDDEYLKNHWTLYIKYTRNRGDDYIKFLLDQYFNPKSIYRLNKEEPLTEEESKKDDLSELKDEKSYINKALLPDDIINYIDSIKETAMYWYYSFNPYDTNCSFTDDEKLWIDKLNRINLNYFRTLVVASFLNKKVEPKQRIILFKTIEKFDFLCFKLGHYNSSYFSSNSYNYARQLYRGEIEIEEVIDDIENNFQKNIGEAIGTFSQRMKNYFINKKGYYSWSGLNYFLFEYEMTLSEKMHIVRMNDWSNFIKNKKDWISIEHIFPQNPTDLYWQNQFGNYTEKEQFYLANSLGNLLALSQSVNSSLQNDKFNDKKNPSDKRERCYSNGSNSEQEVAKYSDWNPRAILERGIDLLTYMENRWGFNFDPNCKKDLLGLGFIKD